MFSFTYIFIYMYIFQIIHENTLVEERFTTSQMFQSLTALSVLTMKAIDPSGL